MLKTTEVKNFKEAIKIIEENKVYSLRVTTRVSENFNLSNNGGDYNEWIWIELEEPDNYYKVYYSSYDGGICSYCGLYSRNIYNCSCGRKKQYVDKEEVSELISESIKIDGKVTVQFVTKKDYEWIERMNLKYA